MSYSDFLDTVKVLKMLYGRDVAEKFFTENKKLFTMLDNVSLSKIKEQEV